jgi:transcriptional regulator with GAF, ATPase, and Fis domain
VLIQGETGTGKELIARAIHDRSPRRDRPLVKVNCSAISAGLVESELFGHSKGAFTGAVTARTGRFEVANGGTLFLDEIGELPLETQAKLLRVLQELEFEPVGSNETRRVDVRVIAATNRDLQQFVAEGRFRADLYFRLSVIPITMPPLRARDGDVALLVGFFAERFAREFGKRIDGIAPEAMTQLLAYDWPGNVRELSNVIERAVVLATQPILTLEPGLLRPAGATPASPPEASPATTGRSDAAAVTVGGATLVEVEQAYIRDTLVASGWTIEGANGAAARLGLSPSTLRSRMKKLGLKRPSV